MRINVGFRHGLTKSLQVTKSEVVGKLRSLVLTLILSVVFFAVLDQVTAPVLKNIFKVPVNIIGGTLNTPGVESLWQMEDRGLHPVVFTGSSQMQMALSPHLFDNQILPLTGSPILSVNVSFSDANSIMIRDVMKSIILPAAPTIVIYGIEMRALNISTRASAAQLADTPVGYAVHLEPGPEQAVLLWLWRHSAFFRYRDNIKNWLSGTDSFETSIVTDDRGYTTPLDSQDPQIGIDLIRQQFTNFRSDKEIWGAFDEVARLCHDMGIVCIIVNMPIQNAAYRYISKGDEFIYRAILGILIEDGKLPLWDFNTPACRSFLGNEAFFNLNHMNETGAKKFTRAMAALYAEQVLAKTITPGNGEECAEVILP